VALVAGRRVRFSLPKTHLCSGKKRFPCDLCDLGVTYVTFGTPLTIATGCQISSPLGVGSVRVLWALNDWGLSPTLKSKHDLSTV
jgi:hypothetical protein